MTIQPGLYEQLITQALKKELGKLDNGLKSITSQVDPGESHGILARHMEHYLSRVLARVKGGDKLTKQIALACPYYFLGPASYVRHSGSRPMSIVWRLKYPMPARLTRTTRRLAVA